MQDNSQSPPRRRFMGDIQQVAKTGEWFYTPFGGGSARRTGPYGSADAAVAALIDRGLTYASVEADRWTMARAIIVGARDGATMTIDGDGTVIGVVTDHSFVASKVRT